MNDRFCWLVLSLSVAGCGNEKAKIASARLSACTIRSAALVEMVASNKCPTVAELASSRHLSNDGLDSWGTAFAIRCTDDDIHVSSSGPDKAAGTPDDVVADSKTCK